MCSFTLNRLFTVRAGGIRETEKLLSDLLKFIWFGEQKNTAQLTARLTTTTIIKHASPSDYRH